MLSIRRIDIDVPCSIVTFDGGGGGGGVEGAGSAGAGSAGGEFSAVASSLVEAVALSSVVASSDVLEWRGLPGAGLSVCFTGGVAFAVLGTAAVVTPLPTWRLLITSFTPSTDPACRAAAWRWASLST